MVALSLLKHFYRFICDDPNEAVEMLQQAQRDLLWNT